MSAKRCKWCGQFISGNTLPTSGYNARGEALAQNPPSRVMELVEPEPLPEPIYTVKMHGIVQAEGATPDRSLAEGGARWHHHNCTRKDLTRPCPDAAELVVSLDNGASWAAVEE